MNDADLLNSGLSRGQIDVIWHVFGSHPKIAKVLLYGSRAKGNYRENSDIDLTLQGDDLTFSDLAKIDASLDDLLLPYTIDLSLYHQIDNPELVAHIDRVGKVFYQKY